MIVRLIPACTILEVLSPMAIFFLPLQTWTKVVGVNSWTFTIIASNSSSEMMRRREMIQSIDKKECSARTAGEVLHGGRKLSVPWVRVKKLVY